LGPFRILSKIHGDIRSTKFATGVVDTNRKWKKSSIRKIFYNFSFGHLWVVDTGGKFATGITAPVEHLDLRISPRIFEKNLNGFNGLLWGWGETDS
jgi:hypothetical protein